MNVIIRANVLDEMVCFGIASLAADDGPPFGSDVRRDEWQRCAQRLIKDLLRSPTLWKNPQDKKIHQRDGAYQMADPVHWAKSGVDMRRANGLD
jgi:hypothetical protein